MKELNLDLIKELELKILIEIDKICRINKYRYMLCGGTLLGAVRHNGFIPWDDDIDIFMPRPDYNKFIKYCINNPTTFELFSCINNKKYDQLYAKACDKNTVVIDYEGDRMKCRNGIWVDIFPIDGLGNSINDARKFFNSFNKTKYLHTARRWSRYKRNKRRSIIFEPIRFSLFIFTRFSKKNNKKALIIDEKVQKYDFDKSAYCGCIYGSYGQKEIMEKDIFIDYIELKFENYYFMCPKKYDYYLRQIYGDYMKLPPLDKQVTHHDFKAYYIEEEKK